MTEQLTKDELQVCLDLWACRLNHKAGAVKPEYLPAAHNLAERGWLSRRIENDDVILEFTDQGLTALELSALQANHHAIDVQVTH
jgi:hypothetical protein